MTRRRRRSSYYKPMSGRRLRLYTWRRLVPWPIRWLFGWRGAWRSSVRSVIAAEDGYDFVPVRQKMEVSDHTGPRPRARRS